ncbi:MAG: glycosyltransferase [Methanothrix sp.]|uniref:glycosyltransferase n=1 Tax=Methanothrix sp. TaxID=90426 RepID=UPI0025CE573B|nr:glycosyltransferase [Methanothrix sp.]MCQ8903118.1 glycosyltransferase [Methanothrix sp.]
MKVLLLANQPEKTTRLRLFEATLKELGYETIVPRFDTVNWISIARKARETILRERPDVVHLFNVPDVIYHWLPGLRGSGYKRLIYDYRSPWGVETQLRFGSIAKSACEHFERQLAEAADMITTVNTPLREKARAYAPDKDVHVIPNYPRRSFAELGAESATSNAVIFVGRVCEQEGIDSLLRVAGDLPDQEFWIVGGGPFAWWYLRRAKKNVRAFGWQPHERVAALVSSARICIIPRTENALTPYSTDKSIWKLNEYLNLGKQVVASGITLEERRKNLWVVRSTDLRRAVEESMEIEPEPMKEGDYRFWEENVERVKEVYESV